MDGKQVCWYRADCGEPVAILAGADGFSETWGMCEEHGRIWREDSGAHFTMALDVHDEEGASCVASWYVDGRLYCGTHDRPLYDCHVNQEG